MTIKEQAVSDAMIEKVWADFVNCQDDRYFGNKTKRGHQLAVLRRFADSILASHPLEQQQAVSGDVVERLHERLADTQMLAFKWMEAHDKLHAGKPYEFPKPADLPDALAEKDAEIERLRAALTASGVGRMRSAAQALIDDVRRRYPGEELRCPLMIELDTALQDNDGGMEGG